MQSTPSPLQYSGEITPNAPSAPVAASATRARARRRVAPLTLLAILAGGAALAGVLLGGRVSAENGLSEARDALAAGDAGGAVGLDASVAGRNGLLMVFDPGAPDAAAHDEQVARLAWARQLAGGGDIDAAIAALAQVSQPSLLGAAATVRTEVLVAAADTAVKRGQPSLALQRLHEASDAGPPAAMVSEIASRRAADEVAAAAQLLSAGRPEDALAFLDDARVYGAAAAAAPLYPAALLAAARDQLSAFEYAAAAANLQRLIGEDPYTAQAVTARSLLRRPQAVSGTLVDSAGHPASGRVRLGSHYSVLYGGYATSGPFYYGIADAAGDFRFADIPVGGPYVLEYYRGGGWMTLVDPRTDQPANPVTVNPLTPVDLTFIVLPN